MSSIPVVIVEDSRLARNELKELIRKHEMIELLGEAENVDEAFELIKRTKPKLLFLDINMPEKDGFELLEMLDEVPMVIFTTAFDEYAIKSFEYNALDYLLKPINETRFASALEKVVGRISKDESIQKKDTGLLTENSQIFIKEGENCWLIKVGTIFLFEIVGNYTRVYFEKEKPMLYKSLNQIEVKLPDHIFFRANRQQIVNIEAIAEVVPWFNGKLRLRLNNGETIEVSRRQSYIFKDKLSF